MQERAELRPKSASFNCFGPKKNQHLTKAKSLLSTAASNARFSHVSQPRRGMVAAKHLGSHTDMISGSFYRLNPEEVLGMQLNDQSNPALKPLTPGIVS